jgi:hypothetical protein
MFVDTDGYFTWQETASMAWLFNFGQAIRTSDSWTGHVMKDQNDKTWAAPDTWPTPYDTMASVISNNWFMPRPESVGGNLSVRISSAQTPGVPFRVWNNYIDGYFIEDEPDILEWKRNVNTGQDGAWTGSGSDGSDVVMAGADVFENPSTLAGLVVKAASPIRSEVGTSLVNLIENELKPRFQHLFSHWDRDIHFNQFDPANPPIGAAVDYDYTPMVGTFPTYTGSL